ncbi:phospholipase D family protein [Litoreibacter arenae]|uniref:Phospholipase D n=1 Tax=Litoreibacter arenae DSM 19593 TaxID=1123360 RepID=S9QIK5_9RHOB|nr:phospholipase D family protein [Litoreibacter arenae]EPX79418.1 Cardiolipin synthetase [Litoreibacter arenae DSM 19593]
MITFLKYLAVMAFLTGVVIVLARLLFPLPKIENRVDSSALPPPTKSALVSSIMRQWKDHPDKTGVAPLIDGAGAFAARVILADAAVSSIDAQYYIWHDDLTGALMLDALKRAADRGVRVRLLLDDNGIKGLDPALAALNAHENVEVRLYNPFNLRTGKLLSYGFDFFRLNRRMHNKSFTVDGMATILGGRNIGDEYFDTGPAVLFVDLDVLAVGKIVPEVAADFDRYWAAKAVYPAEPIIGAAPQGDPIEDRIANLSGNPQLEEYREIVEGSDLVAALLSEDLELEWTDVILVSDDPIKGLGAVPREDLLATRLLSAVGNIEKRFDGITPYLVPGKAGVSAFSTLESSGVTVRMLTNSLEATDVLPVHAGYTKHRRNMLKAGVELFELQTQSATKTPKDKMGPLGSSGASLHAKTFSVDGKRVFIGSFNFDPRSTTLNTEMGLLIESETMAERMHQAFDEKLGGRAWEVTLEGGHLSWTDGSTTRTQEPGSSVLRSFALTVIGWLPVEWLL